MSKLFIISLFILTISIVISNLSPVESNRNDSESAEHRIQKRTFRGQFNRNTSLKYMGTVFHLQLDSHFCAGTFIAPNAILTAANCCVNVKSTNVSVQNELWLPRFLAVRKYHIHPDYKSGVSKDDIAVIKLIKDVERINQTKLDYSGVECGATVLQYGYDWQLFGPFKEPKTLRAGSDYVINVSNTTGKYFYKKKVLNEVSSEVVECLSPDDFIYTHTKNGCFNDAGGPVFNQKGELVGVQSGGGGGKDCSKSELNYAVRVSSHKHFVQRFHRALRQKSASSTLKLNSLIIFFSLITFYVIY